jgi:hypothetical protein
MFSFFEFPNFELVKEVAYVVCDFFSLDIQEQHYLVLHNTNKYCFSLLVRGLNLVSSICMGLSFAVDIIGWGGMEAMKILCTSNGSHGENTLWGGHFGHFHDMYVMYIFAKLVTLNFGFHFWCLGLIF